MNLFVTCESVVTHVRILLNVLVTQWQVMHERAAYNRLNKPIKQSLKH